MKKLYFSFDKIIALNDVVIVPDINVFDGQIIDENGQIDSVINHQKSFWVYVFEFSRN